MSSGLWTGRLRHEGDCGLGKASECEVANVRIGEIMAGPGGMGTLVLRCPISTAKALAEAGKLLVGWRSARVKLLEQCPLRCYDCMGIGHTRPDLSLRGGQKRSVLSVQQGGAHYPQLLPNLLPICCQGSKQVIPAVNFTCVLIVFFAPKLRYD